MNANEKLTALADEVRELSGTTATKGIDDMKNDVDAANAEIAEQVALISQITVALEGKTSGSGGVTLPDLTNPASASDILSGKEAIDEEGGVITGTIQTKTASNLTASGATVTVPVGYYATQATKSVSSGSAKTPATTITKTPTISVSASGLITASVSGTQNVTPTVAAGYVSSGTAGTITVSGSNTKQLTTQAAKTVTPTTSSQTAVVSGVYTTGAITVAAIPSNYEDVGAETTTYTSLTSQLEAAINSLPEAGSGGGSGASGVDTCTVIVEVISGEIIAYAATVFVNNEIRVDWQTAQGLSSVTINNVVCGSFIMTPVVGYLQEVTNGVSTLQGGYGFFRAPLTPGAVGKIIMSIGGG